MPSDLNLSRGGGISSVAVPPTVTKWPAHHDGWELVHGQPYISVNTTAATFRMSVPGGWLYRYVPYSGPSHMVFVPQPHSDWP